MNLYCDIMLFVSVLIYSLLSQMTVCAIRVIRCYFNNIQLLMVVCNLPFLFYKARSVPFFTYTLCGQHVEVIVGREFINEPANRIIQKSRAHFSGPKHFKCQ